MQEEINQKTIALCVKGGRISASLLKAAMKKFLADMERRKQRPAQGRQAEGKQKDVTAHGKQSLKKLMRQGSQLTNIEITDKNIKSFDRVARKYSIDYSLKKDSSTDPPRYLVFFKAKDVDVMTKAFQEYAGVSRIRMIPLTLSFPSCTPSCLISSAIKRMMSIREGCHTMCVCWLMSLPILDKFPNSIS